MIVGHMTHAALATAGMIAAVVVTATAGDILTASAMRQVGDLDRIRSERGLFGAAGAVLRNERFGMGVVCLALSFFSLLYAFSHRDLSLIGPAATSLTFVTNALAAKFFLHENVDRRRWMAAICVCVGVALVAF
ncbi:MAG: EamA family transporter [Acidobacteriaceae bacterium]